MKSLTAFLQVLVGEAGKRCHISTIRDQKTIADRVKHEGYSFLTITLPSFGKDLQKGLDQGKIAHDHFAGFQRSGGLPRFLGGFLELVFDRGTGLLLDVPSIEAIRCLHQITSTFAKVELPCSENRIARAKQRYIECEQEVRLGDQNLTPELAQAFEKVSRILFADVFSEIDLAVYQGDLVPRHGPGATADRLRGNAKFDQKRWTHRLEEYFPAGEFLLPNWRYHSQLDGVDFLEPGDEMPVRVITVPKTLKTPRIIAIEPTCMQYAQQALLARFVEGIERSYSLSPFIGFTNQIPNRDLACIGSIHGTLATLDLSEASDRVSNQHVRLLLRQHPHLRGAVEACRSRKADVDGKVFRLAKFASMGSALCFPMEAMVFLTIIFVGISQQLNRPMTKELLREFRGQVRVYGDDIIVPVDMMEPVSHMLSAFGLKVNVDKSFGTGKFRESCGGDYYDGRRITPVRVRSLFPTTLTDVTELISTVALRNLLFQEGWSESVDWLDDLVKPILRFYPEVYPTSPVLGRHTWDVPRARKMSAKLQIPLVKGYVVSSILPVSKLEGAGALVKFFIKP
ncbi:RNA-directed RNA polymerase, partial [ssRNA phage Esthiorhiza.1_11]